MTTCAVKWCGKTSRTSSYKKDGITFHKFPKCPERKAKWIYASHRGDEWLPTKNSVICSRHFTEDNFCAMKNRRRLMDSAIPTLNLPVISQVSSNTLMASSETNPEANTTTILASSHTPTKKRRHSDPISTTPSAYDTPIKKRLCRRIIELDRSVKSKNAQLRKLRDSNRSLKRQVTSLKSLLAELEKKNLITAENSLVLDSLGVKCSEIVRRQLKSKSGKILRKKYTPQLRAFALTLNFYSTKAYNYVRKTFNSCLPSVKTLGKWYSSVDGQPGFTKEAFEALRFKSEQSETRIHCCIVFDEMKIKSKIEKSYGYVDFGGSIDSDGREECTEALVYLVVPFHGKWKVPIGYFFINKMTADQKVFLLKQALELCSEANIDVKCVTFDGCPANIAMAKKLGCDFDNVNKLKTTFKFKNNDIAVFLDPAHMIKLVRNSFEHYKEFQDVDSKSVKWEHLQLLHRLQEDEKFHAANKLRAEHLYFKKNVMKVRLATQLFSRSVALALLFCKNTLQLKQFQDIDGTVKMLMCFNDVFDILDSKVNGYGLKRALNTENAEVVLSRLEECKNTLITLSTTYKNKPTKLIYTPRCTGFLGLCICIESAKILYSNLIETRRCRYISYHRISQDHIELLFCNIRSRGGANNNPTPKQFHGIYRKLLVHMELQDINSGNCVALEKIGILNCSSAIESINISTVRGDNYEIEKVLDSNIIEALQQISLSQFSESIVEYIAGAVVHYLIKKIKCNICVRALVSLNENSNSLIRIRDVGGLLYPSHEVTRICRRSEQVIRNSLNCDKDSKIYYRDKEKFVILTLSSFVNENLFNKIHTHQFDHESCNHLIYLAKSVIDKYIDIRLLYLTRKNDPNKAVRRIYTKLIHFKNQ